MASGSWADWATALVALLALVAAFWAGRAAWKQNEATVGLLKLEKARVDKADDEAQLWADAEARHHQADRVAVWTRLEGTPPAFVAVIRNQSQLPVYDAKVTFVGPDRQIFADESETGIIVPPGDDTVIPMPTRLREVTNFDSTENYGVGKLYFKHELDANLRARIEFRDTLGRSWVRHEDGTLSLRE